MNEYEQIMSEMALGIQGVTSEMNKNVVTKERIDKNIDKFAEAIAFFIHYPDVFLELITPQTSNITIKTFQRVSLRAKMRKRQVFETATRGASKSWGAFATRYLVCMFIPNHKTFVCTDVKEQAVAIAKEKIQDDLWRKYPLLSGEMVKYRVAGTGVLREAFVSGKGYAEYRFTSGSVFDVVGVDSARGKRRNSGLIEEVIEQDATKINEKILPLMNISRFNSRGLYDPKEQFNAQKIYVTSAGFMDTFAYDKMLETLMRMVIYPNDYFAMILDYRIPVKEGLLNKKALDEAKLSPTFTVESFQREYASRWSGAIEGAAFTTPMLQKTRRIKTAAEATISEVDDGSFFVIGADMAKDGAAKTAVSIIKVIPGETSFRWHVVDGYISSSSDYEVVSNELKKAYLKYDARLIAVDANGIGAAIRDWLNKPSRDAATGDELPGLGIINPPSSSEKDVIKYPSRNVVYEVKANGSSASDINWFFFGRVKSGLFRMLVTHRSAAERIVSMQKYKDLPAYIINNKLAPYAFCDKLEEELLNLSIKEGTAGSGSAQLKVERRDRKIQKDLFSSVSYVIYATHLHIEQPHYKMLSRGNSNNKLSYLGAIMAGGGGR